MSQTGTESTKIHYTSMLAVLSCMPSGSLLLHDLATRGSTISKDSYKTETPDAVMFALRLGIHLQLKGKRLTRNILCLL